MPPLQVRVILNKSDQVDQQQLMRVYGALMWSLGKVFRSPEVRSHAHCGCSDVFLALIRPAVCALSICKMLAHIPRARPSWADHADAGLQSVHRQLQRAQAHSRGH